MRMKQHRRILKEVLETDEKEREQKIERVMPTLRSLIDNTTFITGLADGASALIAPYILCTSHNINTVDHYQDVKTRLMNLINPLSGGMIRKLSSRGSMEA